MKTLCLCFDRDVTSEVNDWAPNLRNILTAKTTLYVRSGGPVASKSRVEVVINEACLDMGLGTFCS